MATETTAPALFDEEWVFPTHRKHQHAIASLMSFHFGRTDDPLPKTTTFTKAQLLEITPSIVRRWLLWRAYGDPDPSPDAPVNGMRAGSLEKLKQAASFFMPNKHAAWIEGVGGNPTRHTSLLALIKEVEKKELRGQGLDPNDKRAYSPAEFDMVLKLFRDCDDFEHRLKYPMMTLWAQHLIHRLDDTCHFRIDAPHGCPDFPFAIKTRTKWSKNVRSLKECPPQFIFGAMDWKACVQLNLAVYLDEWLLRNPNAVHMFTTNDHEEQGPANLNSQYGNRIKIVVWLHPDFVALLDEVGPDEKGVGTHSTRKYASTRDQRRGAKLHQVEYRGRWVGEKSKSVCGTRYIGQDDRKESGFDGEYFGP